jgi:hypothetical protein
VGAIGRPIKTIGAIARGQGEGLIVMGLATRPTDVPQPGSVAYGVLRLPHTPVLVIPPIQETATATASVA